MPRLEFTVEEAPRLLRALASHDAELFERARAQLARYTPPPPRPPVDGQLVHVARAER